MASCEDDDEEEGCCTADEEGPAELWPAAKELLSEFLRLQSGQTTAMLRRPGARFKSCKRGFRTLKILLECDCSARTEIKLHSRVKATIKNLAEFNDSKN